MGKHLFLSKLKGSRKLRNIADEFYLEDMSIEDIGNGTIRFFELLYSASSTLQQIRKQEYNEMVEVDCSKVDPAFVPPSSKVAFYHGHQVYHQIQIWKQLSDVEKEPLRWGWVIENKYAHLLQMILKQVHLIYSK